MRQVESLSIYNIGILEIGDKCVVDWYHQFFQVGAIPDNAMYGYYDLTLVFLSYIIASFASFVALDMSAHLRKPNSLLFRGCWLMAGSFAMGGGIWSMHFVGMLAFIMPMPMGYDLFWTGLSMIVAVVTAAIAFTFLMIKHPKPRHYVLSGIILGIAIPTMHYTGMAGMSGVVIHYIPLYFYLSILIAVIAATASIWFSVKSDHHSFKKRLLLRITSALIMGLAICSMHYVGMFAAVFTPLEGHHDMGTPIDQVFLALFITTVIMSILIISLIFSTARYFLSLSFTEKSNNFLNAVLDNMREGVIACNAEGKITLINRAAIKLFNSSNDIGKDLTEWVATQELLYSTSGAPIPPTSFTLYRALKGETVSDSEIIFKDSSGKKHTLLIDGQPLVGKMRENLGAVVVLNDISSSTAAEHASMLKTAFLATMSHEIRTPLNGVMGMLQLLKATHLDEKQTSFVQKSLESATTLLNILGDILDFSKIEAGMVSFENISFPIKKDLETLASIYQAQCQSKNLKVTLDIDQQIPATVLGDPTKFKQIVNNLVSNAIKFTPEGGTIAIKAKVVNIDDDKLTMQMSITDSGIGIPAKSLDGVFEMFSQADNSTARKYGGTGLGLAITKQLVELMGGKISVESKVGEGSTFTFTIKFGNKKITDLASHPKATERDSEKVIYKMHVLIVEDNELNQVVASEMLGNLGCSVNVVSSGETALKAVERDKYDLILLDCQMPGMSGFETAKHIRKHEDSININEDKKIIIAVTANALHGTRERCLDAGMNDYLTKPIDFHKLKDMLKKHFQDK